MDNKWWCATIIMCSSVVDEEDELTLCDEQIHVVKAHDLQSASEKSIELGKNQEHSYESIQGQTVFWKFVGVQSLEELFDDEIVDGSEIRSKLIKTSDPESLLNG